MISDSDHSSMQYLNEGAWQMARFMGAAHKGIETSQIGSMNGAETSDTDSASVLGG